MKNKIIVTRKEELIGKEKNEHPNYSYKRYVVTERDQFNQCYIALYEIPPLKSSFPFHYHQANTEAFYIISGEGILQTEDGLIKIGQGSIIVCPPGSAGAHKITNTSETEKLVYIDFDTTHSPDIVHYPDTNKIGVIVQNQSSNFYRKDSEVDYYDGED